MQLLLPKHGDESFQLGVLCLAPGRRSDDYFCACLGMANLHACCLCMQASGCCIARIKQPFDRLFSIAQRGTGAAK